MAKAKAFRIVYEIETEDARGPMTMKGTLIAARDRFLLVFDGDDKGKKSTVTMARAGREMVLRNNRFGDGKDHRRPIADGFFAGLAATLAAEGATQVTAAVASANPVAFKRHKPTTFLSASTESIGGLAAELIDYEISAGQVARCSLWLDAKTGLPVKRSFAVSHLGIELSRTAETYREWTLDPPLPEGAFALPPR